MPNNFYGWTQIIAGATVGLYLPVSERAKDYDCFSILFQLGNYISDYARFYDSDWASDTTTLVLLITLFSSDSYHIYKTVETCMNQLTYSSETNWLSMFDTTTTTDESAASGESLALWTGEAFEIARSV